MKKLLLLLGGPDDQLKKRWEKSLQVCKPLSCYDIVFTGLRCEWELLKDLMKEDFMDFSKVIYITSWGTWSNIINTKHIWEKYDIIYIVTSSLHISRVKKVFGHIQKGENVYYIATDEDEVCYAKISLFMYSSKIGCKLMNFFSRLVRCYQLID